MCKPLEGSGFLANQTLEQHESLAAAASPAEQGSTVAQKVGAALVTLIALWLLFGIPVFLLFHIFFE